MQTAEHQVLNFVRFVDLNKWSANSALFKKIKSSYPLVPLSKILKRVKNPVVIEDKKLYKRITVRLYGQGVLKRDELYGKNIGTKRQFIAREGQLIISRIDARNGAFGIVPRELDGAIVTNDFWLFDVQNAIAQYIVLVLSSERFQRHWQAQSSGTTNRQRIDESTFLGSFIALPTINTQMTLLDCYHNVLNKIPRIEKKIDELIKTKDDIWCKKLVLSPYTEVRKNIKLFSTIKFSEMSTWTSDMISGKVFYEKTPFKVVKVEKICAVKSGGTPSRANPEYYTGDIPWVKTTEVNDMEIFDTEEKITELAIKNSSARVYSKGSIIVAMYGHTRGKTAMLGIAATTNQACAVLHDINTKLVLPEYLWLYMQSQYHRIRSLAVGSAQPNLNGATIKNYPIVLPPISSSNPNDVTQESIVKMIKIINNKISHYTSEIDELKKQARLDFEEEVFGET